MRSVKRIQYPIGQGGLHLGIIKYSYSNEKYFVYLYDCGSVNSPKKMFKIFNEFKVNIKNIKKNITHFYIFISHLHHDHYNFLDEIIDFLIKEGLTIQINIELPYISDLEKLIIIKNDLDMDNQDYINFISNPQKYLEGKDDKIKVQFISDEDTPSEKQIEEQNKDDFTYLKLPPQNARINHSKEFKFKTRQNMDWWLLKPFVKSLDQKILKAFEQELKNKFEEKSIKEILLEIPKNSKANLSKLKAAYKKIPENINNTSLCLYSGRTHRNHDYPYKLFINTIVKENIRCDGCFKCGWMHTGDINLSDPKVLNDFKNHYHEYLGAIAIFQLPHHGSKNNSNNELKQLMNQRENICFCKHFGMHNNIIICDNIPIYYATIQKTPKGKQPKLNNIFNNITYSITEEINNKLESTIILSF